MDAKISHQESPSISRLQFPIFSSAELLEQPWLPGLTRMVNDSYMVNSNEVIKYVSDKTRLSTDSQLSEEVGPGGFTVVALSPIEDTDQYEVVGTASMKKWKDDGLWRPVKSVNLNVSTDSIETDDSDEGQIIEEHPCIGDYELAVVAIQPGRFRGTGLPGLLVKRCYDEVISREKASGRGVESPIKIMIRTTKENTGEYWIKKKFTPVGSRLCPIGFWGALSEFTMWAMLYELAIAT